MKDKNLNLLHLRIRKLACSRVLRRKRGEKMQNQSQSPKWRDFFLLFPPLRFPFTADFRGNLCERVIHPEDSFRHLTEKKPRSALSPSLPHSSFPDAEKKPLDTFLFYPSPPSGGSFKIDFFSSALLFFAETPYVTKPPFSQK